MARVQLGRHGGLNDDAGDPLDGLVNLFDIGIVLAIAFLIAGMGLSKNEVSGKIERRPEAAPALQPTQTETTAGKGEVELQPIDESKTASGKGVPLEGKVYRLPDGKLILVDGSGNTTGTLGGGTAPEATTSTATTPAITP